MKSDKLEKADLFTKDINISTQSIEEVCKDKENSNQQKGSNSNYLRNSATNVNININTLKDSGSSIKDGISSQDSFSHEIELKNIILKDSITSETNSEFENVNSQDICSISTSNPSERKNHHKRFSNAAVRKKPINIMQKLFVGNV
ncbi:hypothetical protein AYI70_g4471 [Smittium culicis]|uniref:Uncharacterized protein n=1 Tax=Smittium culicis TaxID=133412 RepID=A0A1R1XYT6_9FUNG|nr:hypothetical protein AYI70_g4471 [Smittium culicis]